MIPRKWEWITEACLNFGYEEAAAIAHEIDQILMQLYPKKLVTQAWEKSFEGFDLDDHGQIEYIIGATRFCTACSSNYTNCENCLISENFGCCYDDDSLFAEFLQTFYDEV